MTTGEFVRLQEQLNKGSLWERRDLIEGMSFARLIQLTQRLTLRYDTPSLNERTWKWIAIILAIRGEEYRWKIDGPYNPCLDPLNPACDRVHCEAVSAEEMKTGQSA